MATTGVPSVLYESNDAPDLVSGAFATHTHELGKISSGAAEHPGNDLPAGASGTPIGLAIPADPDYPSDTTQLAVLSYQLALPDGVVFNGFSVDSSGDDIILWLHAKNTTSSNVTAADCAFFATVMLIRE